MEHKAMDSLLSLDMLSMLIEDLNKEINYKMGEYSLIPEGTRLLHLSSDGSHHGIYFLGDIIYSTALEKQYEKIPVEKDIVLNERNNFENHLRNLINDKINMLKNLEL